MNEIVDLVPTRQSLLSRLKDLDDDVSWRSFFETYWKLIFSAALRSGLRTHEAEDVVQETVLSVSKAMPGFKYDPAVGSFKSWLLTVSRRRISDQFRKRKSQPDLIDDRDDVNIDELMGAGDAVDAHWEDTWEKNIMDVAIERVKQHVDAKQFQMFDLVVLRGWPATKVVKTLKVSAGRIYVAKHRVQNAVKKEVERLQREFA
jgi:RNA polymerase sigma-70 factor (ECF subfamily)